MSSFNLDSAIEREKGVQVMGVYRKLENFVVTLLVMKIFYSFLGASRTCAFFRDSTAEFRFYSVKWQIYLKYICLRVNVFLS